MEESMILLAVLNEGALIAEFVSSRVYHSYVTKRTEEMLRRIYHGIKSIEVLRTTGPRQFQDYLNYALPNRITVSDQTVLEGESSTAVAFLEELFQSAKISEFVIVSVVLVQGSYLAFVPDPVVSITKTFDDQKILLQVIGSILPSRRT